MQCKIHAPIEVEGTQQSNQGVSAYQGKQRWCCRSPKQEETYTRVDTRRRRAGKEEKRVDMSEGTWTKV